MSNDFEKSNKIDELESELYSPNHKTDKRTRKTLRSEQYSISQDWGQANQTSFEDSPLSIDRSRKNWFLRFFIIAFLFFLAALGYVGYKFLFQDGIDAKNVEILVNAPLTVGAGETFTFDVLLQNKNQVNMQTVDITVEFPDGTRSVSNISEDYKTVREQVGDITIGAISKKNYSALLFGEEGDKKEVAVSLSYRVEGSNALFTKEKKFEIVLKSTPIRLTITNVKELTSGQPLTFNMEIVSNSTQILENVIVQATYPFGFIYRGSSLSPKEDNKTWVIPKLEPKEIVRFTIDGTIEGQNNEQRYFSFVTGLEDKVTGNPQVVFSTDGTTVTLARPFLDLDFAINKDNSDVIVINPNLMYDGLVSFKNNTDIVLRNVALTLKLEGSAINKNSIQVPEGFYQSTDNTIVWDNTTAEGFKALSVGRSGSVSFNFSGMGINNSIPIINPEITLTAQVEGNRNPEDQVSEIIEKSITKKIRLNTQVNVNSSSGYYDSVFLNTGPIPPRAEQKTFYTATVELSNSSNRIENGIVTMLIPNYVTYEGKFLPSTENFSYDETSRMLSWNVGGINTKTGYEGNEKRKISFQVSIVPSMSQLGQAPNLVYNILFNGFDSFTKKTITKSGINISTATTDAKGMYDSQVSR